MVADNMLNNNAYQMRLIESLVMNYTIPGFGYFPLKKLFLGISTFLLIISSGIYGLYEVIVFSGNAGIGLIFILFSILLWIGSIVHIYVLTRKLNSKWLLEMKKIKWKNPFIALTLSYFIPGIGQLYAKKYLLGILFLIIYLVILSFANKSIIWNACGQFIYSSLVAFYALQGVTEHKPTRTLAVKVLLFLCMTRIMSASLYAVNWKDSFSFNIVNTSSMEPTLRNGDVLLLRSIEATQLRRGDIVVFKRAYMGYKYLSKRIIAFSGESVKITNGRALVNGSPLSGQTSKEIFYARGNMDSCVIVNNDAVFVLGDNTNDSYDSREFGSVPINDIIAVEAKIIYPIDRINNLRGEAQ